VAKNYILPKTIVMNFSHYPVLKVLLPYISGIIFGYFLPIDDLNLLFCIFTLLFCGIVLTLFRQKKNFFRQKITTVLLLFLFCFAGYSSVFFHFHKNPTDLDIEKITQKQIWIAEIKEPPRVREKSFKVIAKLRTIDEPSYWITKKTLLYFQKDSIIQNWKVGDKVMINTKLSFIDPPKNPHQFNYQKFMKRKGILLTGYIGNQHWEYLEEMKSISIKRYASYMQRALCEKLVESGVSGAEFSVVSAILLGNDETLEPELRAIYAATGASHILCVSGMHVGVIFMILGFLLQPLDRSVKTRYVKNVLLLIAVWIYANITGLAPSVTRSAAMFTFVITGKFLQRKTNVFHSLFASLFILLATKPLLLFELGFQLSYLAVFGIVIFQNKITQWVHPKTKTGKYIWDLLTVSLVAQMATSPIAVYYFGLFPNYFLLTNLFIIPLSFVITVLGVATLAFSFSGFLSNGLGFLLNFVIKVMNTVIFNIEQIPGAVTSPVSINLAQVLLLYLLTIIFYIFRKNVKKMLIYGMVVLNVIFLIYFIDIIKCKHHVEVVRYEIPKSATYQFCYQGNAIIFSDSIHSESDKRYQFSIQGYDNKMRIKNTFVKFDEDFENSFLCKKREFIFFQGTVYVLERNKLRPNTVALVVYNHKLSDGSVHELN